MSANSAAFERASQLAGRLLDNVETVVHVMLAALIAGAAAAIAASASAWTGGVHAPRSLETVAKPAMQVILRSKLDYPTGLAVDPRNGSLWIVNRGNNSITIVDRPGSRRRVVLHSVDYAKHYLWRPAAIAFSRGGNEFATAQDIGGFGMRMGPTLWPGNASFYRGNLHLHRIHLDMLHHSPQAVGIAAGADETRREHWVFNGAARSIDRYFFNEPHSPGANDHGDGLTYRYAAGEVRRRSKVPGHLALDRANGHLYIADTGNRRIARLVVPASVASTRLLDGGSRLEGPLHEVQGSTVETVVPPSAGLQAPSGLVLHAGTLWVGDYATGRVHVFRLDGSRLRVIDTGLGRNSLTGLALSPDGWLYVLDARRNRVLRLRARG
jgi:DNA-binding beta-propeller fold protein YncE